MGISRSQKLEQEKEKRLIKRIVISIFIGGLVLGSVIFFSGRKIETGIKEGKIEKSENKVDQLEAKFNKKLKTIDLSNLNNTDSIKIENIKTLIEGFKGAVVSDSLLMELDMKIENI